MKKLNYLLLIITLTISSHARLASYGDQRYAISEVESVDDGRTYTKKTCRGGYKALKKEFKSEARKLCSEQHQSPLGNQLKKKHYVKFDCKKKKVKGKKTKVTVFGHFSFTCR